MNSPGPSDSIKVLFCSTVRRGGVSLYVDAIRSRLSPGVQFLAVGSRTAGESRIAMIARIVRDAITFTVRLYRDRFDIVHVNPSLDVKSIVRDGLLLIIAKFRGVKRVALIHGWQTSFEQQLKRRWMWWLRRALFTADSIVVLSRENQGKLRDLGYRGRIERTTSVVEDRLFDVFDEKVIGDLHLKRMESSTILFLSRIQAGKGVYETIETFRHLQKERPGLRLVISGDGMELENVRRYAVGTDGIDFTGWVTGDKKIRCFREATIFILPSHSEGMPLAVLEAMACGLPVVTRPVGGLNDFFENEKMGIAISGLDPKDFADAIDGLLREPANMLSIGLYNHLFAKTHYNSRTVAHRLENIYRGVLQDTPKDCHGAYSDTVTF